MPCPHWGQSLPLLPPRGASLMSCKQVGQLQGLRLMLHSFRGRRLLFARSYMKEFLIRFFAPLMYPASIRGLNSTLLSDGALTILTVDEDVFYHAGAFKVVLAGRNHVRLIDGGQWTSSCQLQTSL